MSVVTVHFAADAKGLKTPKTIKVDPRKLSEHITSERKIKQFSEGKLVRVRRKGVMYRYWNTKYAERTKA